MAKRLFIALEPPEHCRETLAALDPEIKGLRWLASNHLHMTLSFIGRVDASAEGKLREALSQVHVPPFFLTIQGMGTFGGSRPTVVWTGVGSGHPHLFALHKHIQDGVLRAGLEPDLKPFHPHITVARTQGISRAMLTPFLRRHAESEWGLWKVTSFTMFSSVLSVEGATYAAEMRWTF